MVIPPQATPPAIGVDPTHPHAPPKISPLLLALAELRPAARRHGRVPVQGLRPHAALHEVRLGQVRRERRLRRHHGASRGKLRRHGRRSRGPRRSATGSTRSSARSPTPTTSCSRAWSTRRTSMTRRSSAGARRCRTASRSWWGSSRGSIFAPIAHGDDLLGDAYEYLMRHFATQSGKSKGQFYTPAEVSRIMAQVIGIGPDTRRDHTVYDPTCGSGSLLIKAADPGCAIGCAPRFNRRCLPKLPRGGLALVGDDGHLRHGHRGGRSALLP